MLTVLPCLLLIYGEFAVRRDFLPNGARNTNFVFPQPFSMFDPIFFIIYCHKFTLFMD